MRYLLVILTIFVVISSAQADYIEPSAVKVETERYTTSIDGLSPAKYSYEVSWQGIPVGVASVEVAGLEEAKEKTPSSDDLVTISAEAQSAKLIDVFYKLRHESVSTIKKTTFQPVKFQTWQKENSRIKTAKVDFLSGGLVTSVTEKDGKVEKKNEFKTENFILDPISAAFFARSIPINIGLKASFDVYNGKHRYLITFEVVALEDLNIMGGSRKAYKVVPTVQKLTDTEGEKRLTAATIWIAADDSREVLKLESKVFVGSVNASLVKVDTSPRDIKLAGIKP